MAGKLGPAIALPVWLVASAALADAPVQAPSHPGKTHAKRRVRPAEAAKAAPAEAPLLPMPASVHAKPDETPVTTSGRSFQFGTVTVTPGGFIATDGISRR